jgi:ATPase subunit of ABC transporter with duplicated ATPase domains
MTLIARDLTVEVASKTIVQGVSFEVRPGDKVGLVGRNGAGKTTLFRVLGGAASPTAGAVRRADSVGYLSQDPRADAVPDDTNCLTHVLSGRGLDEAAARLEKLRLTLEEDPSAANVERFGAAQEHFEHLGGYAAEAEVRKLVTGLGLRQDRLDLTLAALSGGERRRLELARILFAGSELLLLDEPTNHLDLEAVEQLEQALGRWDGSLVVVSHDRRFLEAVEPTRTLSLS